MLIHENDDWRDTCRELDCPNSIYNSSQLEFDYNETYNSGGSDNAFTSNNNNHNNSNSGQTTVSIEIVLIIILFVLIFCMILCAICIFCGLKNGYIDFDKIIHNKNAMMIETIVYNNNNKDEKNDENDDDDDIDDIDETKLANAHSGDVEKISSIRV